MSERVDGLPTADDTRSIVDDSHPILKGRLAAWALPGDEEILGLCPVHGGWGGDVGQHIPGMEKMCKACATKIRGAAPAPAPGNPLNL